MGKPGGGGSTPVSLGTTTEDVIKTGPVPSQYKNLVPGTYTTEKGAAFTISATGTWTYDPTGSAQLQALRQDTDAVDAISVSTRTGKTTLGTITVTGVNDAPTGPTPVITVGSVTENTGTHSFDLKQYFSDPDGDALVFAMDPSRGQSSPGATLSQDGILRIDTDDPFWDSFLTEGEHSLSGVNLTVSDGNETFYSAANVTFVGANNAPTGPTPVITVGSVTENTGTHSFDLKQYFSDPDGDALVFAMDPSRGQSSPGATLSQDGILRIDTDDPFWDSFLTEGEHSLSGVNLTVSDGNETFYSAANVTFVGANNGDILV